MITEMARPYESKALRAVTGPAIRPGGLGLTRRAARFCGLAAGERVLDVGCGTGATVNFLNRSLHARAVGIDRSSSLLGEAGKMRPPLALVQGDAAALPLGTRRFAAVFCECVLSLIPEPHAALKEFWRVLRPGGHLVVADLYRRDADLPTASFDAPGCVAGALTREEMAHCVERAGFTPCLWEDHSRQLKTLAAQLVWAGVSVSSWRGKNCRHRTGYALLVAIKGNPGEASDFQSPPFS